jgi:hypothetical protein
MNEEGTDLPTEIADRLARPFARFLKIRVATGVMFFVATVVALIVSRTRAMRAGGLSPLRKLAGGYWP